MTGQLCPECGTPRDAYGRPGVGCDCAERAAIAAAEGFDDPLRIRPYVTLDDPDAAVPVIPPPPTPQATTPSSTTPPATPMSVPTPPVTSMPPASMPLPPLAADLDGSEGNDPSQTMRLSLPGLRTVAPGTARDPERRGGRKPFTMVALGAAAVAVIGTVAFAGGLFGQDDGSDTVAPDQGLPTASVEPESSSPAPSPSVSESESRAPTSGPPSPSDAKPSQPRQESSAAVRPANPPSQEAGQGGSDGGSNAAGLRRGDSGAKVSELQQRLSEVWLFNGEYNGQYDERVEGAVRIYQSYKSIEGDPEGVYGANTRRALEAETSGRGREQGQGQNQGQEQWGDGDGGHGRDRRQ